MYPPDYVRFLLWRKTIETQQKFGLLTKLPRRARRPGTAVLGGDNKGAIIHVIVVTSRGRKYTPGSPRRPSTIGVFQSYHIFHRLEDFPGNSIKLHFVTVLPDSREEKLKKHFCTDCLTQVIGQKELADPDVLGKKLGNPTKVKVRILEHL